MKLQISGGDANYSEFKACVTAMTTLGTSPPTLRAMFYGVDTGAFVNASAILSDGDCVCLDMQQSSNTKPTPAAFVVDFPAAVKVYIFNVDN
jgi:hypothetical protein